MPSSLAMDWTSTTSFGICRTSQCSTGKPADRVANALAPQPRTVFMKILYLLPSLGYGGPATQAALLSRAFTGLGQIHVCTFPGHGRRLGCVAPVRGRGPFAGLESALRSAPILAFAPPRYDPRSRLHPRVAASGGARLGVGQSPISWPLHRQPGAADGSTAAATWEGGIAGCFGAWPKSSPAMRRKAPGWNDWALAPSMSQ